MHSKSFRASLALQIARAAIPGAAIATFIFVNACTEQEQPAARVVAPVAASAAATMGDGTYYGANVRLAAGLARTYVTIQNGAPAELGVELNRGALEGLPTVFEHGSHGGEHHMMENAWELPLPAEAGSTAYRSVNVDWMPNGHDAPYNRPHFDFHFYVIPTAERLAIDPADPEWVQKASNLPPQQYWPARYFPLNLLIPRSAPELTVPAMGLHWLDVAAPEVQTPPAEFSYTFFYGSWNGAIIFDEPMITKKLLDSRATVDVTLPPAADYSTTGYRAGGYRVYWNEATQRHRVALTQLAER